MTVFGLYGASGFGREVMPVLRQALTGDDCALFLDDGAKAAQINGHQCVTFDTFLTLPAEDRRVCLAIADSSLRARLAEKCRLAGVGFFSVRAPNCLVMDDVTVGEGAILSPFVTLTSNIRIGRHFHANIYSYVAHDCVIGDFVTFAPRVMCNGNVTIGDHAYIGTGAILRQGKPGAPLMIGAGAVVGMGRW